jgi:hypothetical protein
MRKLLAGFSRSFNWIRATARLRRSSGPFLPSSHLIAFFKEAEGFRITFSMAQ